MQNSQNCISCKNEFVIEDIDREFYARFELPNPEQCPDCRWKYLMAFWIFGRFRITNSALSQKRIITVLPESVSFPIYEREEFVSDAWDPLEYGQNYDDSKLFMEQLLELQSKVPHPHQVGLKNTNCDWTDDTWESKNAYLTRSALNLENISYGYRIVRCKNSIDLTYSFDLEQSYDCIYCFNGFKLFYSFNSRDCIESAFLYDCRNCQNCFMSWNLRNQQYCILNQPYSKEEYFKKLKQFNLKSHKQIENLKKEFWQHIQQDAVHRANFNLKTNNSTGNFLTEDNNCQTCCFFDNSENCRYCYRGYKNKDSIDAVGCMSEKTALSVMDQWGYENFCTLYASSCRYSAYLDNCEECEYCFGCVGLRKKKYCILNKQYTKEEYDILVEKIKTSMKEKGEWGKYFPLTAAYAGYNYSLAAIMLPENQDNAIKFGAKWEEPKNQEHLGIRSEDLPDEIDNIQDDIVKQRIICPETKLSYNITAAELQFYREHGIPLPREHFDWRTLNRFRPLTYMTKLQIEKCIYCQKQTEHYYSPKLEFQKIACVDCYQKKIA